MQEPRDTFGVSADCGVQLAIANPTALALGSAAGCVRIPWTGTHVAPTGAG